MRASIVGQGLLLVLSVCGAGTPRLLADETRVGALADVTQYEFRGCDVVSAEELRAALRRNWAFLKASHPQAKFETLLPTLQSNLLLGYLASGFPDASVTAKLSEDRARILVSVVEGKRFRMGEIRVQGPKKIAAADIVKRLTSPTYPDDAVPISRFDKTGQGPFVTWYKEDGSRAEATKPLWRKNEPANFQSSADHPIARHLRQTLNELGFSQAKFRWSFERRPADELVDLAINIDSEGEPLVIREIKISGCLNQKPADVLACFDKRSGDTWKQTDAIRMSHQLWQTGRFALHKVRAVAADSNGVRVEVNVREYPLAPSLSAPPSPNEIAMLRLRDWLLRAQDDGREFTLRSINPYVPNQRIEFVVAPRQGVAVRISPAKPDTQREQDELLIVGDQQTLTVGGSPLAHRFQAPLRSGVLTVTLRLGVAADSEEQRLTFGLGYKSATDKDQALSDKPSVSRSPVALDWVLSPAYFLAELRRADRKMEFDGELATVRRQRDHWRFNTRTGELVEWRVSDEQGAETLLFRPTTNRFQELQQQANVATEKPNQFQPDQPLSSVVAFALELLGNFVRAPEVDLQLAESVRTNLAVLEACRRAVEAGVLHPLDKMVRDSNEQKHDSGFFIPLRDEDQATLGSWVGAAIVYFGFPVIDELFRDQTWPWQVSRETGFVVAGFSEHAGRQFHALYIDKTLGPLGHLATAFAMKSIGRQDIATAFAKRGLEKIDVADFQNDCDVLFDPTTGCGRLVTHVCQMLRKLDDKDIELLGQAWLGTDTQHALDAARILRQVPAEQVPKVLNQAWSLVWVGGLRERIRIALQRLSAPTP